MTHEHRQTFVAELKKLKSLPYVKDGRLIIGGPSVTDPIERSKGFEIALVSYHAGKEALAEYQASDEHHRYDTELGFYFLWTNKALDCRVTSTYMFPYKEDLMRFDFEVDQEDEHMCSFPVLNST